MEIDANGNQGSAHQQAQSGPIEGSTDETTNIRGLVPEGERQEWWPEGVNSEAELKAWVSGGKPNASDQGADPEKPITGGLTPEEEAAKAALLGDDKAVAKEADTSAAKAPVPRTDDEIRASLKVAGGVYADPKYEPFALEVEKTGKLSPESIAKAATDFGVPAEYVQAFVDGQLSQRELATTKATQAATVKQTALLHTINGVFTGDDGPKQYEQFITWGATNLSEQERKAYDGALDRNDTDTVGLLLGTFKARYEASGALARRDITRTGTPQADTQGTTGQRAVTPFASLQEGRQAMATRRYAQDPAYRALVDQRYIMTEAH